MFDDFNKKDSVVIAYTGDGKGKTTAALGLMVRALGAGFNVAFIQFIKQWDVSEDKFIRSIEPIYKAKLAYYKGGLGFYEANELSADASKQQHLEQAKATYALALRSVTSGDYNLVICDEINNAVESGLLKISDIERLINQKNKKTSLCLTGRNLSKSLIKEIDIVTNMTKIKHHFDDKILATKGIDY